MTPNNVTKFYKEMEKFSVEELKIISDYPFTSKMVDISQLEVLVDNKSFDYWFKLYLPTILFNHIENLNKVK
jgi:hypothetical protein